MDGFEEALELGEPDAIERNGRILREFLHRHGQGLDDFSSGYDDDNRLARDALAGGAELDRPAARPGAGEPVIQPLGGK
jgi:hypothetical protein